MSENILSWIRPEIRDLKAYHVVNAEGIIKMDAMENPYGLPEELLDQWVNTLKKAQLNRYPDPVAADLKVRLRKLMKLSTDQEILLGNGSDELIQMITLAVASPEHCLLSFEPGFVMYKLISTFAGMKYIGVSLHDDFTMDVVSTVNAIEKHNPAVIFIAYPNNPTGNLFAKEDINKIIDVASGIVVIDEAYQPFAQESYLNELGNYNNLLVMRTVSKMGLAGLRLGFLCGPASLLNEINKVRLPYNINILTQLTAEFILKHSTVLEEQASIIRSQREFMLQQLMLLRGIKVFPSQANFILFKVSSGNVDNVFARILERGVLIKNMSATDGPLKDCLRVTIGTPEENAAFLDALRDVLRDR